jgi:hypothetical protein
MIATSAARKAETERSVFLAFAERLNELDVWLSVESTDPPAPDLLCTHAVTGRVAFELVAITDPLIAKVNAGWSEPGVSSYETSDPTERIIRKKLRSRYETQHPLELIAYNDNLVITPEEAIISRLRSWLDATNHPFRRAWYMGEANVSAIWSAG